MNFPHPSDSRAPAMSAGDIRDPRAAAEPGSVVCPECGRPVPAAELEVHLRREHQFVSLRGLRMPLDHALEHLLDAVVADRPDAAALAEYLTLCREHCGRKAERVAARGLGRRLARFAPGRRADLAAAVAPLVAASGAGWLTAELAADDQDAARHLALEVIARLPLPLPAPVLTMLRGLLLDRRLPEEAQFGATGALLRSLGPDDPAAEEYLRTLVSGLGKRRSIDRLRRLQERTGRWPAAEALAAKLEDRLRMTCPRCAHECRRPEMIRHLWEAHQLLLVGRRVREPWSLIEEWLTAARQGHRDELVGRCRTLLQHLDLDPGLARFNRLALAAGVGDEESRRDLLEVAEEQRASVCPRCYVLAPLPREQPPCVLNRRGGRISGRGYVVDVSERGWRSWLDIRTPERVVYRGREPGLYWTPAGAIAVLVGPFVLLALLCAFGVVEWGVRPVYPVAWLLSCAAVVYGAVRLQLRSRPPPSVRAQGYAWTVLAPRLHARGFDPADASWAAGLALDSGGDGYAAARSEVLPRLTEVATAALRSGAAGPGQLFPLVRLAVADAAAAGADPVPLVADHLAHCFEGRLPFAFADRLLDGWKADWRSRGSLARLRVLACDRAFAAGFEVRNLIDAGQTAPALAAVLGTDRPVELAALRLLWSLRPARPWDRCGPAASAFELAADPAFEDLFAAASDLLLYQRETSWPPLEDDGEYVSPRILVRSGGVVLGETLFAEPPAAVRVVHRPPESELVVGDRRFPSPGNVEPLAARLEAWLHYFFEEFRPAAGEVLNWSPPDRSASWRAWGAVTCPDCKRPFLPRPGDIGVALDQGDQG